MIQKLFAYFLISCLAFISVAGIPTWEGPWGDQFRASIGSLVPGASYIEALGPIRQNEVHQTKHLSVASPRGAYFADSSQLSNLILWCRGTRQYYRGRRAEGPTTFLHPPTPTVPNHK